MCTKVYTQFHLNVGFCYIGNTFYNTPEDCWFHIDQSNMRKGLHAYQGAVYLEETTEQDYCFRVIDGFPKYHQDLFETFKKARTEANVKDFYILPPEHIEWYKSKGLKEKKIPVPKGGMVLWDSRTIHDNVKPEEGRLHAGRWRYVVFVCMTPAHWARKKDLDLKSEAYQKMLSTAHWPSQGVKLFSSTSEALLSMNLPQIEMIDKQPDIAKSEEVRRLVGLDKYDFEDGRPNDLGWQPSWADEPGE